VKVIHETLHRSVDENGYDIARPQPGIAVHFRSPAKVDDNLEYNMKFTDRLCTISPKGGLAIRLINLVSIPAGGVLSALVIVVSRTGKSAIDVCCSQLGFCKWSMFRAPFSPALFH
jgi:hypothetical protein